MAGKTLLPEKLVPSIVGHVTRELSRHIWYALWFTAIITVDVQDDHPKRSPLVQGGLEILIKTSFVWDDAVKIETLRKKLGSIQVGEYEDESNEILKQMRVDVDEEGDDDD